MPLADNDLVGPHHSKHIARLLIKKIKVEVIIAQPLCQVFHPGNLALKARKFFFEKVFSASTSTRRKRP